MKDLKKSTRNGAIVGSIIGGATVISTYLAGFTSSGIAAGSIAAGVQSTIGNVAAGSLFATMTSIGMTSVLPLAIGAGTVVGLTAGSISLFKAFFK